MPGNRTMTNTLFCNKVDSKGMFKDLDVFGSFYNTDKGMFYFFACGIALRMDNAWESVSSFLCEDQTIVFFVKFCTPVDQFFHSFGAFRNNCFHRCGIAEMLACIQGIFHVFS